METVVMKNFLLDMDYSKPTRKMSWISRWNLLLVAFCLLDLSNGITFNTKPHNYKRAYKEGSSFDLVCSDKSNPKIMTISKRGGKTLLHETSPTKQRSVVTTHRINNITCDQMGMYECEVLHYDGTKTSKTLDVFVFVCPPMLCSGEDKMKTISATVGETKTVSICVIAFPGLLWSVTVNETWIFSHQTHSKFDVDYSPTEFYSSYYTFNISFKNIMPTDYGLLNIGIFTAWMKKISFTFKIFPKGPPLLCPREEKMKTFAATVGGTKTVSVCVMAYPGIGSVSVNETRIYRNQTHPKFDVDYSPIELSRIYYTVNISLKTIRPADYGLLQIGIFTTEMEQMNYTFKLFPKGRPRPCPGEEKKKTIPVTVGETKTVSICVLAYPGLDSVTLNGTRIYRNQTHPKFDAVYEPIELNKLYYTVNVTLKDITPRDYGLLRVAIQTTVMKKMVYKLTLKSKEKPTQDEIVDPVGEEIPVDVSESTVDYVGENWNMWETLQTESKCQKIKELLLTAKKLLDSVLEIDLCNTQHSSRHDAYTDQTHENGGVMTKFIKVMYLVHCVLEVNVNI